MNKRKTSKKRELSLKDIPSIDLNTNALKGLKEVKPELFFKDHEKIGAALLECLLENDTKAFIEILDEYLKVNRSRVAQSAQLSRSTVQAMFSARGNPTLKTIAKIVHHEAGRMSAKTLSRNR